MARLPTGNVRPRRTIPVARLMRHNTHGPRTGLLVLDARRKTARAAGSTTWSEMISASLSRSTVRDGHGVDWLRRAARAGGQVVSRDDVTGRGCVARAGALPEHPMPATLSNAVAAATTRCPFTWIAPPLAMP